jgi:hypothetical protein
MAKQLTKQQVNKKYKGKYIEILSTYDYSLGINLYEVIKVSSTIRENMTLGEDVGTSLEYRR